MSKYGDILKRERLDNYELVTKFINKDNNGNTVSLTGAYTFDGTYIGFEADAAKLEENGIVPEKADPDDSVCSIGFCEKENKWYGWSHRARYGFGIGDEVKEGDCCASSGLTEEWLKDHPGENKSLPVGFKAKTLEDAKKMAIAFADSVS